MATFDPKKSTLGKKWMQLLKRTRVQVDVSKKLKCYSRWGIATNETAIKFIFQVKFY